MNETYDTLKKAFEDMIKGLNHREALSLVLYIWQLREEVSQNDKNKNK